MAARLKLAVARHRWRRAAVALCLLTATGRGATAQQSVSTADYGSGWLDERHWSLEAVRRLAGLGLAPDGIDLARHTRTEHEIARVLAHAASEAEASAHRGRASEIDAYRARFEEEFGLRGGQGMLHSALRGSAIQAGFGAADGRLATGWGYSFGVPNTIDWVSGEPIADERGFRGFAELRAHAGDRLAVVARSGWIDEDAGVAELYASGRAGGAVLWLGRREHAFGAGVGSGLVLTRLRADGLGVQSTAPFRLPWILRHLGPVTVDASLSLIDTERSFEDVVLILNRGTVQPHERFQLGVTRAAFFGGDGNDDVDWFDIFSTLIGKHAGEVGTELDNQVVSLDASFRPPFVDRWLPLRAYAEWGFEDSAGAWKNVPAILAGVALPVVPRAPALAFDVEYVTFAGSCCGNPIWYRHATFHDGWTMDGRPLGHALGGHGSEWSTGLRVLSPDARVRAMGRVMFRDRGEETLYSPDREGPSRALSLGLDWLVLESLELRIRAERETGAGWRESAFDIALRYSM